MDREGFAGAAREAGPAGSPPGRKGRGLGAGCVLAIVASSAGALLAGAGGLLYAVAGESREAAADGLLTGGILLAVAPVLCYDCARCVREGRVPRLRWRGNVERKAEPLRFWALVALRAVLAAAFAALAALCVVRGLWPGGGEA